MGKDTGYLCKTDSKSPQKRSRDTAGMLYIGFFHKNQVDLGMA
jgi:hypothetical protein